MQLPQIPFEVILAVLFFVLPAVGNILKKRSEGTERERKASTQQTQTQRADTATRQGTSNPQPSTPPNASSPPAEDWLEQARRRVAEAQGREPSGKTTPATPPLVKSRQTPPQTPPAKRPVTRPASNPTRPGGAGRSLETRKAQPRSLESRGLESQGHEGSSLEGGSLESSRAPLTSLESSSLTGSLAAEAPPMRVQRLNRTKRATITKQELRFDAHDLVKGLIWHQVLAPPRSTLRRTRLSRRQR